MTHHVGLEGRFVIGTVYVFWQIHAAEIAFVELGQRFPSRGESCTVEKCFDSSKTYFGV